jgi:hypothetical protein
MKLLRDVPIIYDKDKIISELHLETFRNGEVYMKMLHSLIKECESLVEPKIGFDTLKVNEIRKDSLLLENGEVLNCSILAEKICCKSGLVPYVVTIGGRLEQKVSQLGIKDMLQSFILDMLGNYTVRQIRKHLQDLISKERGYTVSSFTPGDTVEWRLEELVKIVRILGEDDLKKQVGITLTSSFMMIPRKSICGVMAQTEEEFINCRICPIKCEYRIVD